MLQAKKEQHVAGRSLTPKQYAAVVKAKQNVFKSINQNTNYAVKIADLLKRNCTFLYKGYHFFASLNPFSTYKDVMVMRDVHAQLSTLQETLEKEANFFMQPREVKDAVAIIEKASENIKASSTLSKKTKTYQGLSKALTSLYEKTKERDAEGVKEAIKAQQQALVSPEKDSKSSRRPLGG